MSRSWGVLKPPGTLADPGSVSPLDFGTPVTWMRLSVNNGPKWHDTQPALPRNSRSPFWAAADIVPRSNGLVGGSSVARYASRAAAWWAVTDAGWVGPALKKFVMTRTVCSGSVGTAPVHRYGAV